MQYRARIVRDADTVWADADQLLKVKEPAAEEYHRLRTGQVLFTYHLMRPDGGRGEVTDVAAVLSYGRPGGGPPPGKSTQTGTDRAAPAIGLAFPP